MDLHYSWMPNAAPTLLPLVPRPTVPLLAPGQLPRTHQHVATALCHHHHHGRPHPRPRWMRALRMRCGDRPVDGPASEDLVGSLRLPAESLTLVGAPGREAGAATTAGCARSIG